MTNTENHLFVITVILAMVGNAGSVATNVMKIMANVLIRIATRRIFKE